VGTEKSGTEATGSGDDLHQWFLGRLPEGWFSGTPEIVADREEITVVGPLDDLDVPDDAAPVVRAAAVELRARQFRADTREHRIEIAREAEHKFGRKVSWGVRCGELKVMFTTLSVPVMTRLRQSERRVLDTLVDAGVARSRSDALAWCVRLVGEHEESWLGQLREALRRVEAVRAEGPQA
jgi:hypothetical protein